MNRRHLLQALGLGTLLTPLASHPRRLIEAVPPSMGTIAASPDTPTPPQPLFHMREDFIGPTQSVLIGLGPEAELLVRNLSARHETIGGSVQFYGRSGTDPAIRAAWSETPPVQGDLVVLAIDVHDSRAWNAVPFWTERLTAQSCVSAVLLIGDASFDRQAPWRASTLIEQALATYFDGVIEVYPPQRFWRAVAAGTLTEGLLQLTNTLIHYDSGDIHAALQAGPLLRTGALLWNHPALRLSAFHRLWDRLQPARGQGVLAFLHGSPTCRIADFNWLCAQIESRMPDDGAAIAVLFTHDDWPANRQVLSLTLTF